MKKRNFITLILGAIIVALGFLYPIIYSAISTGSTETYWQILRYETPYQIIFIGLLIILFAVLGFIFPKFFEKNCPVPTTIISFAISFVSAGGMFCLIYSIWLSPQSNPIAFPANVTLGVICGICAIILTFIYISYRNKHPVYYGFAIDLITVFLTIKPFFHIITYIVILAETVYHSMIA